MPKFFEENYFSNLELFANCKDKLEKYKTILIDEIQDYHRPWMDLIKEYFLAEDGEYVLWGDEKQNRDSVGATLRSAQIRPPRKSNPRPSTPRTRRAANSSPPVCPAAHRR